MAHGGRRPGAGRKPDAGEPTKPRWFRTTDADWAVWQDDAAALGMEMKDWIIAACNAQVARRRG